VIAPEVRIEAVDPTGFAWLCELASGRQRREPHWLWVRHRAGRVTGSVPEAMASDPRIHEFDLASHGAAAAILEWCGHPRVVLIDEELVDVLGAELDAVADPALDQLALFARCKEVFWNSRAVRTAPAEPAAASGWVRVREALQVRDMVMAIVILDGDRLHLALRADVRDGLVRRLASPQLVSGTGTDLERAVAAIDTPDAADVLVVIDRAAVEDAFHAEDLPGRLLERVLEDPGRQRGLEAFAA
jgi:hypothetical protein